MSEYVIVKLPRELIKEIDLLVGKYGYRSRAEVVKEAVRRFLYPTPPPRRGGR